MPFNGSGVFSRVYNWVTQSGSPPIPVSQLDTQEEDIATALSNCILRDGTGIPTAATPWNSQRITNLGAATGTNDAVRASQLQAGGLITLGSVAGTNTITASMTPALTAYSAGMIVAFTPANNCTGATTINIDSLGAKSIVKGDGTALESGDLQASTSHVLVYDGTNFVCLNPLSFSLVNGTLSGTLSVTGALTLNGALTTDNSSADEVGFKGLPQVSSTISRVSVLSDAGKSIRFDGSSLTATIPANSSVAYDVGTALTFININATALNIAITTDTLRLAGTTTTGTRALAQYGVATAYKYTTDAWIISGSGLS